MASKERSKKVDKETESRDRRYIATVDACAKGFDSLCKWGFIPLTAFFLRPFAGVMTVTDIAVDLDVEQMASAVPTLTLVIWAALLLIGFGGIAYGRAQAKLRKDTTERLAAQISDCEKRMDPRRSTSGLTLRGETE